MAKKTKKIAQKTTTNKASDEKVRKVSVNEILPNTSNVARSDNRTPLLDEEDDHDLEYLNSDAVANIEPGLPADQELSAISPTDPFRQYLLEVQKYPLLMPEEEYRLAIKMRDTGDREAAKTLVTANLRLVVKIAFEYRSVYSNLMDLIQEGNMGLMKSISKYDPSKGARFGYYSSWWIRSYILKYLLENFRLVKIGTTQSQKKLFYHLMREKDRLEAQGLIAAPKLLAQKLDVKEKEVVEMQQRLSGTGSDLSIDTPIGTETDAPRTGAFLTDPDQELPDVRLAKQELLNKLADILPHFLETLNDRESIIMKERILSENPKTLQEVANLYGLTRERVRQMEAGIISKLQKIMPVEE